MIVLDEQLIGYGLREAIGRWYRGVVLDITQLRPDTVIKDEVIPVILRKARRPTLVTINVSNFWRRLHPDPKFLVACFVVPDSKAEKVSPLLRKLLSLEPFRTRKRRMGKIARISVMEVRFYSVDSPAVQRIAFPRQHR